MENPLCKAHTIDLPFTKYVRETKLSNETKKKIIEYSRAFFRWGKLYHEHEFRSLPSYWIEDLTPPKFDRALDTATFVTANEAIAIASVNVDKNNLALMRDQAAACLLFMSGCRASAFISLPIAAVHLDSDYPHIRQWPQLGVRTKNNIRGTTYLAKIPQLLERAMAWDSLVRRQCPPHYPWYAPIDQKWGEQKLGTQKPGSNRTTALGKRLRILFEVAGLPFRSAHKFRHGYAAYGLSQCRTMEEYHALSRNLMHSNLAITDEIYVHLEEEHRAKLLTRLSSNPIQNPSDELYAFLSGLGKKELSNAITIAAGLLAR